MDQEQFALASRNTLRLHHTHVVLRDFNEQGIEAALIKGAALLEGGVFEPDARPMVDVDLIVKPPHLPKAMAVLSSLGYRALSGGEFFYRKEIAGFAHDIDLHNGVAYMLDDELEEFWGRCIPIKRAHCTVLVPDPADHFLYLAYHSCIHHAMLSMPCIRDLEQLAIAQAASMDWRRLVQSIVKWKWKVPFYLLFHRMRKRGRVHIPRDVLPAITPRFPGMWEKCAFLIFGDTVREGAGHIAMLAFGRDFPARFRTLTEMIFPSRDFITRRYGVVTPWRISIFRFLRPWLLMAKCLGLLRWYCHDRFFKKVRHGV